MPDLQREEVGRYTHGIAAVISIKQSPRTKGVGRVCSSDKTGGRHGAHQVLAIRDTQRNEGAAVKAWAGMERKIRIIVDLLQPGRKE